MTRRKLLRRISPTRLNSQILEFEFVRGSLFSFKNRRYFANYLSFQDGSRVFDEMPQRSLYQWNNMLKRYSGEKKWVETLFLFQKIVSHGEKPDNFTVPITLKACSGLREVRYGEMVHGFVKKNGKTVSDAFVGSALIEMYSKCGRMMNALGVFEEFDKPDVVMWTSMVSGYEKNGYPGEAVDFFTRMVMVARFCPDPVTLISLVSACTQLSSYRLGRCVHCFVMRRGFGGDLSLVNSLLNLYTKTGVLTNAVSLFRMMPEKNVISWSSMIACYAQNGDASEALDLFKEMRDKGIEPNGVTIVSVLQACSVACDIWEGRKLHELAVKKRLDSEVKVSTALVDMYMKCFSPTEALDVFSRIPKKDVISWVSLVSGYTQNGMAYKVIEVFHDMLLNETQPDAALMVKILGSCSELGIFHQAVCLHGFILRSGFDKNTFVGSSLVQLYSKCGSLDSAIKVFNEISTKDVVVWSSMIAGYGINGRGVEALQTFDQMVTNSAAMPNHVTFLSTLSACSHTGLIQEGIKIFNTMVNVYKIIPNSEHYAVMVDLLGRVGDLDKAIEIINKLPISPGPQVWGAFLGACRIHQNVEISEIAAKNLFQLESAHAGYYILLSNMHGLEGEWGHMAKVRNLVKDKGIKKVFAQSWVEIKKKIHSFVANDRLHPEIEVVYGLLKQLRLHMTLEVF